MPKMTFKFSRYNTTIHFTSELDTFVTFRCQFFEDSVNFQVPKLVKSVFFSDLSNNIGTFLNGSEILFQCLLSIGILMFND